MGNGVPAELVRTVKTQYGSMVVSSPEFTACSLVQYTKASGGLSHVVSVLRELLDACDFSHLPPVLADFVPAPCLQRLGYIVERVLDDPAAAQHILRFLHSSAKPFRKTRLVPQLPADHCPVDSTWKIIINRNLNPDSDD